MKQDDRESPKISVTSPLKNFTSAYCENCELGPSCNFLSACVLLKLVATLEDLPVGLVTEFWETMQDLRKRR